MCECPLGPRTIPRAEPRAILTCLCLARTVSILNALTPCFILKYQATKPLEQKLFAKAPWGLRPYFTAVVATFSFSSVIYWRKPTIALPQM